MSFKRPKSVYKRFIYLDGTEVVDALAAIRGGDATEILKETINESGGDIGVSLPAWIATVKLGGRRKRQIREEIRLRQTAHSVVATLLDELRKKGGIGYFEGPVEPSELEENYLLEVKGQLQVAPGPPSVLRHEPPNGWDRMRARFSMKRAIATDADTRRGHWDSDYGQQPSALLFADGGEAKIPLALTVLSQYMLVDPHDFSREATVIGQVTDLRLKDRDAPVTVRPICIYK